MGRHRVLLVAVLVQAELGAGGVAIDEAGVGVVAGEAGFGGGAAGEIDKGFGHRRPRSGGRGIDRVIAVAGAVGDPAEAAAIGHGDGHGVSAGDDQVAEGRGGSDPVDAFDQCRRLGGGKAAQQDGAFFERFGLAGRGLIVEKHYYSDCTGREARAT
jgi:hypothetical protein